MRKKCELLTFRLPAIILPSRTSLSGPLFEKLAGTIIPASNITAAMARQVKKDYIMSRLIIRSSLDVPNTNYINTKNGNIFQTSAITCIQVRQLLYES